jgi:hypothetical protein
MPNVPNYNDLQRQQRIALDNNSSYKAVMQRLGNPQAVLYNPIVETTRVFNAAGALIASVTGNIPLFWVQNQTAVTAVSFASDNSITSIGAGAFYGTSITSAIIPMGVTTLGSQSFSFCTSLTSVTIPSSVISIDAIVFASSINLSAVNCFTTRTAFVNSNALNGTASPLTVRVRASDGTWTAGNQSFQGNANVNVIKNL